MPPDNATTVRMQKPDGTLWDIPAGNAAKAQAAGWKVAAVATPAAVPSPVKRLLTQTAGVPEDTDTSVEGMKRDLPSLGQAGTWLTALKSAIEGLNPVNTDARKAAESRFAQHDLFSKPAGALEWIESGVPWAGSALTRASEQLLKGDIAGGAGSTVNAAVQLLMMRGMPEDMAKMVASKSPAVQSVLERGAPASTLTGPVRTAGQFLTTGGADAIEQLRKQHDDAMSSARSEYQDTLRKTREENQSKDVANVSEHQQKLQKIAESDAAALADYRTKAARLQSEFDAGQQALKRSSSLAASISDILPQLRDRARAAAKAAYPKIAGTVDASDVHTDLQSALDARLKGTNRAPGSIARILGETTPPEGTSEPPVFQGSKLNLQNPSDLAVYQRLKARGVFTPEEIESAEGAKTLPPVTFDTLHGYYSELGREMSNHDLPGDERAAITDARGKLLNRMTELADAEHKGPQFRAAQQGWHQLENTFYNSSPVAAGGSPIARALRTADPVTGKLRPDYVRQILSEDKAFEVAKEHLTRYAGQGAPVSVLDDIKRNVDTVRNAPKKLRLPAAPTPTDVPAQPATTYKAPPEAPKESMFDPVAARREILQSKAPAGVTPGLFWKYALLRNLMRKLTNIPPVQDYLSQNPR